MKKIIGLSLLIFVFSFSPAWSVDWHVPKDFLTIQAAIDSPFVVNGDRIIVGTGLHVGASVTKTIELRGEEGATIMSGPLHANGLIEGFRLLDGSSGSTISHLHFIVDLPIMNAAGRTHPYSPGATDVTVSRCTFLNSVQAISNWGGSRWNITDNEIIDLRTRCGGGIGILIADYLGRSISDNVVSGNRITGILRVPPGDCGGYNGSGILLYADFRGGLPGVSAIALNRILKNSIRLTSDAPNVVNIVAISLVDSRGSANVLPYPVILNNSFGFNDLRGTLFQIDFVPNNLNRPNTISQNLGQIRGNGLHPLVFRPSDD